MIVVVVVVVIRFPCFLYLPAVVFTLINNRLSPTLSSAPHLVLCRAPLSRPFATASIAVRASSPTSAVVATGFSLLVRCDIFFPCLIFSSIVRMILLFPYTLIPTLTMISFTSPSNHSFDFPDPLFPFLPPSPSLSQAAWVAAFLR